MTTTGFHRVIPAPASVRPGGAPHVIGPGTRILVPEADGAAREAGERLAALLRPATGFPLPVVPGNGADGEGIAVLPGEEGESGGEGYRLDVTARRVELRAATAAGYFHGLQTIRQLLPDAVEAARPQPGPWELPGGTVLDRPRFAYRGLMLDVVRHFADVEEVKRRIDHMALYKMNHLHLHLTDDQGWRLEIASWPALAAHGGASEVGGGPGGSYTRDDYREIVRYAAERHVTVVPEIDMPGHTNAALAACPELNADGVARPRYTGTEVGFSSLDAFLERTYAFVGDVLREVAELTPGPYLHIGGDEAHSTSAEDYAAFTDRAQALVAEHGKTVVAWHQLAAARPAKDAVLQYWGTAGQEHEVAQAAREGARLLLSPADRVYLDMKYDADTPCGLEWAGRVEVRQSYEWDPGTHVPGVPEDAVLGVEAPLWTETVGTREQADLLVFPRLPGVAELGWSPASALGWEDYRERLAGHAPRWERLGVRFRRSPQVPWPSGPSDAAG